MCRVIVFSVLALYIAACSVQDTNYAKKHKAHILRKTCYLVPEQGPCRANLSMYYFDPNTQMCKTFSWGGCQGNGNRYDSLRECFYYCLSAPGSRRGTPGYCYLAFDYGYCFGAEMRWYYDKIWKVCKHTIFSGCGGNRNNFQTRAQCAKACRFSGGGGGGGGGGGDSSSSSSSSSQEHGKVTNELIINPQGNTRTTTCSKPWHSTTTTTTEPPDYPTTVTDHGNVTFEY